MICGSLSQQHGASAIYGYRKAPQIWRVTANILHKQSRTADKGWSYSLGTGRGAKYSSSQTLRRYETFHKALDLYWSFVYVDWFAVARGSRYLSMWWWTSGCYKVWGFLDLLKTSQLLRKEYDDPDGKWTYGFTLSWTWVLDRSGWSTPSHRKDPVPLV
jgi:hypothetical protein